MQYDDDTVLVDYLLEQFRNLMTRTECGVAFALRINNIAKDAETARGMREKVDISEHDDDIKQALADGHGQARRRIIERVLRDNPNEAVINRCPKCDRIVR